jgi:alginate O-acetyltransferase complex protein AlgJ
MLRYYRRYLCLLAISTLALPLIVSVLRPDSESMSPIEKRKLVAAPELPDSLAAWKELPSHVDAYVSDHFGLRSLVIHAAALVNQGIFHSGNARVLYSNSGWMFYRDKDDGDTVRQSAGVLRRDKQVAITADFLSDMKVELSARGIALLVAPPPNSATIYEEQLPLWARGHGNRTEYDLFLDDLANRAVPAVDLRPPLRDAKSQGQIYLSHDTHWSARGALTAFNTVVEAASHPNWRIIASSSLTAPKDLLGGDLASILGIPGDVSEPVEHLSLPGGRPETLGDFAMLWTADRRGPTIMIIGDSFTQVFVPMLLQHAGRVVWLHHQHCWFDWKWIDQFHPDEVWWMPTERYLLCSGRPNGFPARAAQSNRPSTPP